VPPAPRLLFFSFKFQARRPPADPPGEPFIYFACNRTVFTEFSWIELARGRALYRKWPWLALSEGHCSPQGTIGYYRVRPYKAGQAAPRFAALLFQPLVRPFSQHYGFGTNSSGSRPRQQTEQITATKRFERFNAIGSFFPEPKHGRGLSVRHSGNLFGFPTVFSSPPECDLQALRPSVSSSYREPGNAPGPEGLKRSGETTLRASPAIDSSQWCREQSPVPHSSPFLPGKPKLRGTTGRLGKARRPPVFRKREPSLSSGKRRH